ncbi:MAG: DNA-binding domain-containing protein [Myxococcota bacterium]
MKLAELQGLFWRAITWPTGIDDFLAQADTQTREAFEAAFAQTPSFGRRERMTVYAESYFWRQAEVLGEHFKVTSWLLGEARFHNLATDYLLHSPSRSPDIRRIGTRLPEYVRTHELGSQVPGIEQMAEVDLATVLAVDLEDGPVATVQDLAAVPLPSWPGLSMSPTPGLRLFWTRLPFAALYDAREKGEAPPDPLPLATGSDHPVLVFRRGFKVFHRPLPPPEARAIGALVEGQPFSEICVAAAGPDGTEADAPTVVQWLQRWLTLGLIGRIQTVD